MSNMTELQNRAKELFVIVDGKLLYRHRRLSRNRSSKKAGLEAGGESGHGYRRVNFDNKKFYTHQIIYLMEHGYIPEYIDHIDGNGLNNNISNLRACTKAQNAHNSKIPSHNKSGVKNVEWSKQKQKWHCLMRVSKKVIHIGFFEDLELAELVAFEAREKFHGKFANHGVLA